MPQNIAEIPEFLDEIEIPEGGDNVTRAVLVEAYRRLANRTRNLALRLGGRTGSGEWNYLDADGAPITKTRVINVSGNAPISVSSGATYDGSVWTLQPSNTIRIPVGPIPSGATITRVRAGVLLNGIGAEVTMRFYRVTVGTTDGLPQGRTQIGSDQTWSEVSTTHTLDLSGLSESVNRQTYHHYVELVTGSGGTSCQVHGVLVDFSDPGPRNF